MCLVLLVYLLPLNLLATEYKTQVVEVKDGDTVVCNIFLGFDVILVKQTVRVLDLDTWESTRHRRTVVITDEEIKKGKKATEDAKKLFNDAKKITVEYTGVVERDAYGRLLLDIKIDGKSYAGIMKEMGNARP
jgi:endonuclease YncB( thermonuclease family)